MCSTTLLREPWITTYDLGITIMYIQMKREFIQTLRCVENVKKYRITMPSGSRTDNVFFRKNINIYCIHSNIPLRINLHRPSYILLLLGYQLNVR